MKSSKITVSLFLYTILSIGLLQSCSDDPASSNENPPEVPDLTTIIPDFDFFNQQKAKSVAGENFNTAGTQAQTLSFLMQTLSAFPNSILSLAQNEEASLVDGVWEWEYSVSQGGESYSMRITAERTQQGVEWNSYLTYSGGQGGPAIENYRYMSGTIAEDGTSGVWNIFAFQSEEVFSFNWTKTSETESSIEFDLSSGSETTTVTFIKDGADNTITVIEGSDTTIIYWNSDNNTGYIDENGQRQCWDSSLENTAC